MMTESVPGGATMADPAHAAGRVQRRRVERRLGFGLPLSIIGLIIFMGVCSGAGFLIALSQQNQLSEYQAETADVQTLQLALVDAERGVRGYVLTGQKDYLDPYVAGMRIIWARIRRPS